MTAQKSFRLIIADDHEILIDGIESILLNMDMVEIRGKYSSGDEVIEHLKKESVDLAIMDIRMNGMDGITASKIIKKTYPQTKILILSMYDQYGFVMKAIEADVDGYLVKNFGKNELSSAVQTILNNNKYFSPSITEKILSKIKAPELNKTEVSLTPRESQVLQLLSDGLTSDKIADMLHMSKHTVNTYRKNLLEKFGAKNVSELIKLSILQGFLY